MASTRPYQGFPYTNPTIIDVPTIDRSVTDQWANLPRKPISTTPKLQVTIPQPKTNDNEPETPDYVRDTILYNPFEDRRINIPNSPQTPRQDDPNSDTNVRNHQNSPQSLREEDANNNIRIQIQQTHNKSRKPKENFPESPTQTYRNPSFTSNETDSDSDAEEAPRIYIPPGPRDELNAGPSVPRAPNVPVIPNFMSKEASIYQQSTDDGFPLSPIPVSEFPEPPPAYSEIDRIRPTQPIAESQPPRTQVILPPRVADPPRTLNEDRQHLKCPHCDKQVNTVMLRESGVATHVAAWFLFFVFFPITILIYCTDYCKYKNHYCPECSKLVGYEIPMTCQGFVYAERSP